MATEAEEATRPSPSLPRGEEVDRDGLGNDGVDALVRDTFYSSQSADGGTGESVAPEEEDIISRGAPSPAGDGMPATEDKEDEIPRDASDLGVFGINESAVRKKTPTSRSKPLERRGAFVTLEKAKEYVRSHDVSPRASSTSTTRRRGPFVTTNMNAGLWSTLERRQPGGGTLKNVYPPNYPSSLFPSGTSATSSFTTRKRTGDGKGNSGTINDYGHPIPGNNVRNYNIDSDSALTVTPDKQNRRSPKKGKERIGAGVNRIWEQKKAQSLGLVSSTTSRVMTIGAATSKMMKTIQDEEWRNRWRGIHLPPIDANFYGGNGRQKAEEVPPIQLAPPNGDGRDGSADIPRAFPPKPTFVPRDSGRRADAARVTPQGVPDDQTRKEPVPSSWFLAYPDQPSVPLYPLLVCVLLHWLFKNYFLRRVFTYKGRTLLMRSVKEKLSELRYGGSSRQFRLTQEELEAHMKMFKIRNSFKSKRDASVGNDGRSSQDKEDGDGNLGGMGGGGMGSGGGSGGNMGNGGDAGDPSNSKSDGEKNDNEGVHRDISGDKTSQNTRLNDLGMVLCDWYSGQTSFLEHRAVVSEVLLHSANKELAANAVRANKIVEELREQLSQVKEENAMLSHENNLLAQTLTKQEGNGKEMASQLDRLTSLEKRALALQGENVVFKRKVNLLEIENKEKERLNTSLLARLAALEKENKEMDIEIEQLVDEMSEKLNKGKGRHEGKALEFGKEGSDPGSLLQESLTVDDDNIEEDDEQKEAMLEQVAKLQYANEELKVTIDDLCRDLSNVKRENGNLQKRLDQQQQHKNERYLSGGDLKPHIVAVSTESPLSTEMLYAEKEELELQRTLLEICDSLKVASGKVTEAASDMQDNVRKHGSENFLLLGDDEAQATPKCLTSSILGKITLVEELKNQLLNMLEKSKSDVSVAKDELSSLSEVAKLRNANVNVKADERVATGEGKLEEELRAAAVKLTDVEWKLNAAVLSKSHLTEQMTSLQNEKENAMEEARSDMTAVEEEASLVTSQLSDLVTELSIAKDATGKRVAVVEAI